MKCAGYQLDSFARQHLWRVGLDYLHGTGHGVGSFLNVHEGQLLIFSIFGVMFTVGDFTFWISLSLGLSLRPNFRLRSNLIQKVK